MAPSLVNGTFCLVNVTPSLKPAVPCDNSQVSTRILGGRTVPFSTLFLFLTASRMDLPKILVLTAVRPSQRGEARLKTCNTRIVDNLTSGGLLRAADAPKL